MAWVVPSVWSRNSLISIYWAFWEPDTGLGKGTHMQGMSFNPRAGWGRGTQHTDAQRLGGAQQAPRAGLQASCGSPYLIVPNPSSTSHRCSSTLCEKTEA